MKNELAQLEWTVNKMIDHCRSALPQYLVLQEEEHSVTDACIKLEESMTTMRQLLTRDLPSLSTTHRSLLEQTLQDNERLIREVRLFIQNPEGAAS